MHMCVGLLAGETFGLELELFQEPAFWRDVAILERDVGTWCKVLFRGKKETE